MSRREQDTWNLLAGAVILTGVLGALILGLL